MPKYKEKRELESGNIQYLYGKDALKERGKKKANQCKVLEDNIDKLIDKVIKEIKRGSDEALAIGIVLCTFERIGNDDSSKDGHYGVTNLEGRHFTDHKTWIEINYIGKSGVEQHKEICDDIIVNAIRIRLAKTPANARLLSCTPAACNDFLRPFSCTTKDIRTYAANKLMSDELANSKKIYGNGYKATRIRNNIFNKAAKRVAEYIGHKPSTLKGMYLNPNLATSYIKFGKVKVKADKTSLDDFCRKINSNGFAASIIDESIVAKINDLEVKIQVCKSGYLAKSENRISFFNSHEEFINELRGIK